MTRCPNGTRINKKTGKCEKVVKTTRPRCPNGTRKNKTTGVCVKKAVKTTRVRCPNGTRKNKTTGRCVKKISVKKVQSVRKSPRISFDALSGRRHVSVVSKSCEITPKHIRDFTKIFRLKSNPRFNKSGASTCRIIRDFIPESCLGKDWEIISYLGNGEFGFVFGTQHTSTREKGALKLELQTEGVNSKKELRMSKLFNKAGMSPIVHNSCTFPSGTYSIHGIHMGRIDGTIHKYLEKKRSTKKIAILGLKITKMMRKLEKNKYTHGDFHMGNLGYINARDDGTGKLMLIDHGFSSSKSSTPELEFIQMIRDNSYFSPRRHRSNRAKFDDMIRTIARINYGFVFPRNDRDLQNRRRIISKDL